MIKTAIKMVKRTIQENLVDVDGSTIFSATKEIITGNPPANLLKTNPPEAKNPVVAAVFRGTGGGGVGWRRWVRRYDEEEGTPTEYHRKDEFAAALLNVSCNIFVLTVDQKELLGTDAWNGYLEQILLMVRKYPGFVGPSDTEITWDLAGEFFEIAEVSLAEKDKLNYYYVGLVKTELRGYLLDITEDAAEVEDYESTNLLEKAPSA